MRARQRCRARGRAARATGYNAAPRPRGVEGRRTAAATAAAGRRPAGGSRAARLRVGVIARRFFSAGGAERVTLSLLRMLGGTGHDTTLYTLQPPAEPPAGVRVSVPPGPHRVAPPLLGRYTLLHTDHRPLFKMARDACDVIVVSDWSLFMERNGAERVLFYFNLSPPQDPARPAGLRGLRARARARLVARRAAGLRDPKIVLVPNSEFTRGRVEAVVGRGAHPAVYPPVDVTSLAGRGGVARERRAVTVGRFEPLKRHDASVRIARAAGVPLDIAGGVLGGASEAFADSVEEGASRSGVDVTLHRNAPRDRLVGLLAASKVYLHAAPEDFGISVVEGIAAGCIPIVPDSSAHPETVPFAELRYGTEEEAARKVRAAADGEYDSYLPRLREHARRFDESEFHRRMLGLVEGRGA